MSRRAIFLLVAGVIVIAAMVIPPLMLWGDKPRSTTPDVQDAIPGGDVTVFSITVPEGVHFGNLTPALIELSTRFDIGSAVARTPIYRESVIIARNATQWRTVPEGAVFFLDPATHRAEVFLDHAEFGLFVTKHPGLAHSGARAIGLNELLHLLASGKSETAKAQLQQPAI